MNQIPLNAPVAAAPNTMAGPLAANVAPDAVPVTLATVFPGSTIRVKELATGRSTTGRVIEARREYGGRAEPALVYLPEGAPAPVLLMDDQRWNIIVVHAAEQFLDETPPPGSKLIRVKPIKGAALRFAGGAGSAMSIVRWALGQLALQYVEATDDAADHLIVQGIQQQVVRAGDYVVRLESGEWRIVTPEQYATMYEVIS